MVVSVKAGTAAYKDDLSAVMIPWNPDTQSITVTTDSTVGREVYV